ncbi:hypothetical protein ACFV4F_20315 [Kitasatospora sp. NPDC059722]|uniref:hypothetical protein n=1 Tax=unclassified Kitasatospora TaxID=2633591 RepID=UPI00364AF196
MRSFYVSLGIVSLAILLTSLLARHTDGPLQTGLWVLVGVECVAALAVMARRN